MSVAQASAKVVFIHKSGTYTAFITCDWGDLFQFYATDSAGNTTYTPNFSASNSATLTFEVSNSQVARENLNLLSVDWYFNGTPIRTTAGVISVLFNAVFANINGHTEQIKVIGNIGSISDKLSCTIKAVAKVQTPSMSSDAYDTITASYNVRITQGSADSKIVTIAAAHTDKYTNNFVITSQDSNAPGYKCLLTAKGFSGLGVEMTDLWYYKWYKANPGSATGWDKIPDTNNETGYPDNNHFIDSADTHHKTLTVSEPGVATWGMYKVEAYETSDRTGIPIAFDVQEVLDYSDDLAIEIDYNPKDQTIEEGNNDRQGVQITPTIKTRDTGTTPSQYANCPFNFSAMDSSGNPLSPRLKVAKDNAGNSYALDNASYLAANASCRAVWVTLEVAQQAGGDVMVIIEDASA